MEAKHTATPWEVWGTFNVINQQEGQIATCETKEDAAFIVRACNAHDELVKALQAARNGIVWHMENTDQANECDHEALQQIDAALAKAGVA